MDMSSPDESNEVKRSLVSSHMANLGSIYSILIQIESQNVLKNPSRFLSDSKGLKGGQMGSENS